MSWVKLPVSISQINCEMKPAPAPYPHEKQIRMAIPVHVSRCEQIASKVFCDNGTVKKGVVWKVPSPFPA